MPELKAQYKLTQLIKDIRGKDSKELRKKFEYMPKANKPIDWSSYSRAQIMEMNNNLVLIKNMTQEAAQRVKDKIEPKGKVGPPYKKSFEDRAKSVLVQQLFGVADRIAEGLIILFREKLGITEHVTAKDIERAYDNRYVMVIVQEVFDMTNEPVRDRETCFSVDGTGEPTSIKRNWDNDKDDDKKVRMFERVIGMVGVHTLMFSDVVLADNPQDNESPYFEELLMGTKERYERIDFVYADGMYLSKDNCNHVESVGAKPRILPKTNTKLNAKGSFSWKRMLLELLRNPQKWLEEYHNRSLSESANSSWKRRFRKPLNRIIEWRRKFECFARACVHNIRRLGYLSCLWDLDVPWLKG